MARFSGCGFLPPYLVDRIAASRPDRAEHWGACAERDAFLRSRRELPPSQRPVAVEEAGLDWVVHTRRVGP